MTDNNKSQNTDADLPLYCAFSFPAVLQTLGADHWPLLKPTFDTLCIDMQVGGRREGGREGEREGGREGEMVG